MRGAPYIAAPLPHFKEDTMSVKGTKIATKSAAKTTKSKTKAAPVVEVAKPKAKALSPCMCGCGAETQSRFKPGHDARLHSRLINEAIAGSKAAEKRLDELGWLPSLAKAKASRDAKAAAKAKRESAA
ncbi:MAG: hypothetical protein ACHQ0J_04995 [Candidatus Dormibacterales bacterium]